jgi:hypothetical protein
MRIIIGRNLKILFPLVVMLALMSRGASASPPYYLSGTTPLAGAATSSCGAFSSPNATIYCNMSFTSATLGCTLLPPSYVVAGANTPLLVAGVSSGYDISTAGLASQFLPVSWLNSGMAPYIFYVGSLVPAQAFNIQVWC